MASKVEENRPKRKKTGGRVKGTPNKTTGALKEAILQAAAAHGADDEGKDGLEGYLRKIAREDIKAMAGLLGKVLPMQVSGEVGVTIVRNTYYEEPPSD